MANEANKEYVKLKLTNVIRITRLVSVHYLEYEKNFVFDGESHDFWEMVYVDMGDVVIHADEEEFQLHQGEMVFHKPNEFHKIRANGVTASNVFIVSFVCQSPAMRFFYGKRMKLPLHLKSFISHIIAESRSAFILPCFDPSSKELKVNENAPIGAQQLVGLYLELLLILGSLHNLGSSRFDLCKFVNYRFHSIAFPPYLFKRQQRRGKLPASLLLVFYTFFFKVDILKS